MQVRLSGHKVVRMGNISFTRAVKFPVGVTPGDLVEFKRSEGYSHFGVYVGNGYVSHIASAKGQKIGLIKREQLESVAAEDAWLVNNLERDALKRQLRARDPKQIVQMAQSHVGSQTPYNLITWNCEYFATFCRYGKENAFCTQVYNTSKEVQSVGLSIAAAVVGAAAYYLDFI